MRGDTPSRWTLFVALVAVLALPGALPWPVRAAPQGTQREAMISLYQNTNGPGWKNHTGWLSDPDMCNWYGVTQCIDYGSDQRIVALSLSSNNLTGSLPAQIGDLVDLKALNLMYNDVGGPLPDSLGSLTNLKQLWLEQNDFSGPIPSSFANLGKLEELRLSGNQLTGSVPSWLTGLSSLTQLGLSQNKLTGSVPSFLGGMTQLTSLSLGWNELTGKIPTELGALTNLSVLTLDRNDLSGEIPADIWGLSRLYTLSLGGNEEITGTLPGEIKNLKNLNWLDVGNTKLRGAIPGELSQLTNLTYLNLGGSQFSGNLPSTLGDLTKLRNLYVNGNAQLSGPLPASLTSVTNMYQFRYNDTQLCMPDTDSFRAWLLAVRGRGGVQTNWKICGIEPRLGFSTPYALDQDVVLLHARLMGETLGRIRSSTHVSVTVTGVEDSPRLLDDGAGGDLAADDGHYTRWVTVQGSGPVEAILHYHGWPVISTTLTLIDDPPLIVLTDLRRLNSEFTASGTVAEEDLDGNGGVDFYDLVGRVRKYAEKYRGIVIDLGHTITKERGFAADYDDLDVTKTETGEIPMGQLIRDLMGQIYGATEESVGNLVLLGSRPVVPPYVVDTGGIGDRRDRRRSDMPYAMRSYSGTQQEARPQPDIAFGRVSAGHPRDLAALIDVYEQPLTTDVSANAVTVFRENDSAFDIWDQDWKLWLTPRLASADVAGSPPYLDGRYYYYDGAVVNWSDVDAVAGLAGAAWTVLNSHGRSSDQTQDTETSLRLGAGMGLPAPLPSPRLEPADYISIARQPGHLLINAACHMGYAPTAGTPSAAQAVMDRHITFVGNTSYGREYDDTFWVAFADQLASGTVSTAGAAWVGAYGPYWARYNSTDKEAREQIFVKAFYGLPTQPLSGATGASISSRRSSSSGAAPSGVDTQQEMALAVDVPGFVFESDATGTVVRPANGGSVLEEDGRPMLPLVAAQVILPAGATAVTVTELISERTTENAGQVNLRVTDMSLRGCTLPPRNDVAQPGDDVATISCLQSAAPVEVAAATSTLSGTSAGEPGVWSCRLPCRDVNEPVPSAQDAAVGAYPTTSFRANVAPGDGGWILYLSAIPASYADGQLTVFHHMAFRVRYDITSPSISATITGVTVNGGQPISIDETAVPLTMGISANGALSLTVAYEVVDPAGFSLAQDRTSLSVGAGSRQVAMSLDTRGWSPGPKRLNVTAGGPGIIYDSRTVSITPQGLRLELDASSRQLPDLAWTLRAAVRDQAGATVTGLAGRFRLGLDGAAKAVSFVEDAPGIYRVELPAVALAEGTHWVTVAVSDTSGRAAGDETAIAVGVFGRAYLPLLSR